MGKVPVGVAKAGKKNGCKVIALAGSVTDDAVACNKEGIDAFFPIIRGATTLNEAMDLSLIHIYNASAQLMQRI